MAIMYNNCSPDIIHKKCFKKHNNPESELKQNGHIDQSSVHTRIVDRSIAVYFITSNFPVLTTGTKIHLHYRPINVINNIILFILSYMVYYTVYNIVKCNCSRRPYNV